MPKDNKWRSEMSAAAMHDIDEIAGEVFDGDRAGKLARQAMYLAWLAGAQWGVQTGAERAMEMVPEVINLTIDEIRKFLEENDAEHKGK